MKLTDYLVDFLSRKGITHIFGMSGGAAVHIFDSISKHPQLNIIPMTHEQSASTAADGYSRASGLMGVAVCTSGPGATNLLTGTCSSYYDSIPTLMITGQVATHRLKGQKNVRQLGFQETDVVSIFSPVTKYSVQLKRSEDIRYVLEKAFFISQDGRPGPVLIDIPDDLQRSEIDPNSLKGFELEINKHTNGDIESSIQTLLIEIKESKRPVIILGGGLKTPQINIKLLHEFIHKLGIPVLCTWSGLDLFSSKDPKNIGTFGVYGSRLGNMTVQNSDLLIALGTRLSQNLTGGILSSFARNAKITMVDIDNSELEKFQDRGINIDIKINANLNSFIESMTIELKNYKNKTYIDWYKKIQHWREIFICTKNTQEREGVINAENFCYELSNYMSDRELIFADTGGNLTWTCNNILLKESQKLHSAWNNTPMGYALPAAIGAAFHNLNHEKSITCIIGDGGLLICLAELATVFKYSLPIKIILFNNHCHGIQKQTLETWLDGNMVGVDDASGVAFPENWEKLICSFGISYLNLSNHENTREILKKFYSTLGPVLLNVEINPNQKLFPVLKFGEPLENQMPTIENFDLSNEMIVPMFDKKIQNQSKNQTSPGW